MTLTYALITPARDEEENLQRLGACLAAQTVLPQAWIVVDNGSSDGTADYIREFARGHSWARIQTMETTEGLQRGAPIVRAFHQGLKALDGRPDVVVKLDADVSMNNDYFERLLAAFDADPKIGITSGGGYELDADGVWRPRAVGPEQAWGASRAYRWECLQQVLPLPEAMGWDGIDQVKAGAHGWWTGTIASIPFKHHRFEGQRDGLPRVGWAAQGRASHYMGYRFSYLLLRALHHARRDRAALALIQGYVGAALTRAPRYPDEALRSRLRRQQRLRAVVPRLRQLLASGGPARSGTGRQAGSTRS
jgi:glycosyltransferase involved in cell wall biosynthesis